MDSSSKTSSTIAYIIVGVLTCATTIAVTILNRRYSKRIKPDRSVQSGYSEWVAYLEREIKQLKNDNGKLNERISGLEQKLYEKENLVNRMRNKLLEMSRKYDEDISNVIN